MFQLNFTECFILGLVNYYNDLKCKSYFQAAVSNVTLQAYIVPVHQDVAVLALRAPLLLRQF